MFLGSCGLLPGLGGTPLSPLLYVYPHRDAAHNAAILAPLHEVEIEMLARFGVLRDGEP